MSELTSANWNFQYGTDNPKNILNKVSHLGALPINQHYVFFKNGATSMIKNDENISPEIKKALEDERRARARLNYGDGTERPIAFNEQQMIDLYYNSYGLDCSINSIGYSLDTFTLGLLTGSFGGTLIQLLYLFSLAQILQGIIDISFISSTRLKIPKIGYTDYYTYETKDVSNKVDKILSQIVKRKHPYVDDQNKLQKDQLINLSSEAGFRKTVGVSSYDTILSKYQLNAGAGFMTAPLRSINRDTLQSFIDNLKANSSIKYDQLNKLKNKYSSGSGFIDQSKITEESILDSIKSSINGVRSGISIYIDFSDYVTILSGSRQKGYPNPQKEKSIFGPYICRSKKVFLYYPKIIIVHPKYSTLSSQSNGIDFLGGVNIFGGFPSIYSTAEISSDYIGYLLSASSIGKNPIIGGYINYISKDRAFNLGAGYSEDIETYKARSIC